MCVYVCIYIGEHGHHQDRAESVCQRTPHVDARAVVQVSVITLSAVDDVHRVLLYVVCR